MSGTVFAFVVSDSSAIAPSDRSSKLSGGNQLIASQPFRKGDPVLVEAPILLWNSDDSEPEHALSFSESQSHLLEGPSEEWHKQLRRRCVLSAALKGWPVMKAFQRLDERTQQLVLKQTQTRCSQGDSPIAMAVEAAAANFHAHVDANVAARVLSCAIVNNYDFEPEDTEAVFLLGSKVEHSCDPNVCFRIYRSAGIFCGGFEALRDIKVHEPILNSYLDEEGLAYDAKRRRMVLYEQHGFICACHRCNSEGGEVSSFVRPSVGLQRNVHSKTKSRMQLKEEIPENAHAVTPSGQADMATFLLDELD